jgi:hypothetical protein
VRASTTKTRGARAHRRQRDARRLQLQRLVHLEYLARDPSSGQDDGIPPGKLARIFGDGFEILRDDVVDDVPDWAMDRAKLARFVARKT